MYGHSVAAGAEAELGARGLHDVGTFGYDFRTVDMAKLVRRIARRETRRAVRIGVPRRRDRAPARSSSHNTCKLLANIGTSSSYCMPAFGSTLGKDAVGVYASDKPVGVVDQPVGAAPRRALVLAARERRPTAMKWDVDMSPAALAGFSAAWALFTDVLPAAASLAPADVAAAARAIDLPRGSLPNGSGLRFGAPGTANAGDNVAAASVIWEWVAPGEAAVIWPPAFATDPMDPSASDAW